MTAYTKAWIALASAFGTWGVFPIFIRWMSEMRADELLYVRIAFSFFLLLAMFAYQGKLKMVWEQVMHPRFLLQCGFTSIFIALNWLLYIVAINMNLTTQASIGYFITPLINVMFGVWFFGERMNRWKVVALTFAFIGVLYQMIVLHMMPWLALGIGGAFGIYGSLRKKMKLPPVIGMFTELLVLMPVVMIGWGILVADGKSFDYLAQPSMILMCVAAGVVTLVPLLLYLYAVQHLSLTAVGFAQYSTPTMQFLLAVYYFHEPFDIHRLFSFILIWTGLAIYSIQLFQQTRRKM